MRTLKDTVQKKLKWSEKNMLRKFFIISLPPMYQVFGLMLWPFRKKFFEADLDVLRQILEATELREVSSLAREFGHPHRDLGFWRDTLGVRPRGRRVMGFARDLYSNEDSLQAKSGESRVRISAVNK